MVAGPRMAQAADALHGSRTQQILMSSGGESKTHRVLDRLSGPACMPRVCHVVGTQDSHDCTSHSHSHRSPPVPSASY